MNNERRKQIEKATALLNEAREIIEAVQQEEQDAFENMPEGLQQGERGQAMEEAASELENAVSEIEGIISSMEML